MRTGLFYIAMGLIFAACGEGEAKILGPGDTYHVGAGYPRRFQFPDGTRAILSPQTSVSLSKGFGKEGRDIELDGEAMIEVGSAGANPVVIHTRDLSIEVLAVPARFHVAADRSRPGEQADLLEGKLSVRKAYHSDTDNEPEILAGGDMVMINRDIDLMEKERLSAAELDKLKARP